MTTGKHGVNRLVKSGPVADTASGLSTLGLQYVRALASQSRVA